MRMVQFPMKDRLVLTPVELVHVILPTIAATIILYFLAGSLAALAAITTALAGTVFSQFYFHLFPRMISVQKG